MTKLNSRGTITAGRPTLADAMQPVIDLLVDAHIRVAVDVKQINPPGCFLHPPVLVFRWRAGDFTATHRLLVVAAASQRAQSYLAMSELLDQVAQALGDLPITATPADVETSDRSTYLTAYELTWTDRVRQTTEGNTP